MRQFFSGLLFVMLFMLVMSLIFPAKAAELQYVGVHTLTKHEKTGGYNEKNWGIQLQWDSGLTLGGYRNSYSRDSFYIAYTQRWKWFSMDLGLVSGYQKKTETTMTTTKVTERWANGASVVSTYSDKETKTTGSTRGAIGPLLAISIEPDWKIRPKLTILPGFVAGQPTVFHLLLVKEI